MSAGPFQSIRLLSNLQLPFSHQADICPFELEVACCLVADQVELIRLGRVAVCVCATQSCTVKRICLVKGSFGIAIQSYSLLCSCVCLQLPQMPLKRATHAHLSDLRLLISLQCSSPGCVQGQLFEEQVLRDVQSLRMQNELFLTKAPGGGQAMAVSEGFKW